MKKIFLLIFLIVSYLHGFSQTVSIVNNKFVVNGNSSCPIYFNGSNNPWESWDDFGGTYNVTTWDTDMKNLKANGINTARIWFSCDGNGQPKISTDGSTTSAPSAQFWQNCDSLFASAKRNGIYIMATMMSFDHTKNANTNSANWQNMLNSSAGVTSYVNNYIVPFVNRYKTNPYLWSIDICNEIEWIYENGAGGGDGSNWKNSSYPILQRFVAMCAAGIHNNPRTDGTTVLATVGSASVKWNGSLIPAKAQGGGGTNSTGNKWSDANLKAQYNQTNAVLDFYSPHYYGWMEQYYSSPFENTPAQYGMSEKPCVVGEMPAKSPVASDYSGYPTATMTLTTAFNNLLANGWQGHQPWTANITTNLTAEVGDLATFGSYAQAFYNSNTSLVKPNCPAATCTTTAPTTTKKISYCMGAAATALTATAGTGGTLNWYTVATAGTASSTAPTPTTTTTGTTSYYVSQTIGCESPRDTIVVTVNAVPAAPTVSPVSYCQNATATALTATGTALKWYTVATNGTSSATAPTPSTTATGTTSYYVSQTTNGCESPRAAIAVTINAIPAAPTVSPVSYCQNATATALTATATGTLNWYTVATNGTASTTAPTPSTTATGTTSYYVSQTTNGCESPRAAIAVTINAISTAPTVTSPVSYCQNATATALTATGTALKWYTVETAGTASATAPTPATTATGTTSYYVSQTTNSCESPRAAIAVTVNAIPAAPTVSPVSYCQNTTATALTATGTALKWYTVATNGTSSATAPTPSTTATGTTSYYVSQTTNGCESPRAAIAVTVNAIPAAPIVSPVSYCQNATATALTATGTALKWYTVATNGTASSTAPTPATTATGTTSYYVSQTTNGCESPRAATTVTVNAIPAAPTVSPVSYCQNAAATALTATATGTLNWYTVATNGTSSATAPTPSTTATGTTSYYVSQTTNTCESPRAAIAVTINAIPAAPTVSPVSYCQNATATALTATGTALKWYTVATNGTASATAPTPSTTATGTTSYYVSQTTNTCESPRAAIAVTVSAAPTASNAGAAQYITSTSANLSANVPTTGTGTWSVLSGTANFANSTSATTSVSGLSAGANVLQWTIANGSCPSSSSTVTINVGTSPTTQTITGPTQVTTNATEVVYSVPDNNGSHYLWTLPTGVTIVANNTDSSQITVSFGSTGGTLSVTETNLYGNATSSINVSVGNAPSSQTISGPAYVTPNETAVAYSVPDDNGSHYLWTLPPGATIASHNADSSQITVNYGTSGGTISVTETNPYGNATSSLPVSLGNAPTPQTITGEIYVPINSTGVAYSIPDNNGSHYLWTLPTGATIASHNADSSQITINYGTNGGTLSVTETNPYGNASSSLPVSVGNAPTTQTITGEIYVPINSAGVAYSVPDDNGSHYKWTLPAGASIATHNADSSQITVDYGTSGGTLSVTETSPYGSATSTVTVSVGATPTTQTITGPATVTANETGVVYSIPDNNGSTYHWTIPAGASISMASTDSSQITVNYGTSGGIVTVTETNPYGNATSTLPVSISSTTAVIAGSGGDSYEVKPNPFSDYTTIIVHHSTTEQITLSVINVQGISCFTSSQYYTNQEFTIGSELTTDGVYFVQLSYGAEVKVLKLVKVR